MKKLLKFIAAIILIPILAFAGLIAVLTFTEYKPAGIEPAEVLSDKADKALAAPASDDSLALIQDLQILSWNIGYGGLGKDSDFFMDGGSNVRSADKDTVTAYLNGQSEIVASISPDILMLQEVDADSTRTFRIDERCDFLKLINDDNSDASFALNYNVLYVPFPLPPIGKVTSGLLTVSSYDMSDSSRIALPCPFSWPIRVANLKRCLNVSRLPLGDSGKDLVIVNLHLEAYDNGSGKLAQTKVLNDFISAEYNKGNYVIAGGDFNQIFPGTEAAYPNAHPDLWAAGALTDDTIPSGFTFAYDPSTPTCRLLNQPYDPSDKINTQYYVIDGFILSPNVELKSVETIDAGFEDSDHNPVLLDVSLS